MKIVDHPCNRLVVMWRTCSSCFIIVTHFLAPFVSAFLAGCSAHTDIFLFNAILPSLPTSFKTQQHSSSVIKTFPLPIDKVKEILAICEMQLEEIIKSEEANGGEKVQRRNIGSLWAEDGQRSRLYFETDNGGIILSSEKAISEFRHRFMKPIVSSSPLAATSASTSAFAAGSTEDQIKKEEKNSFIAFFTDTLPDAFSAAAETAKSYISPPTSPSKPEDPATAEFKANLKKILFDSSMDGSSYLSSESYISLFERDGNGKTMWQRDTSIVYEGRMSSGFWSVMEKTFETVAKLINAITPSDEQPNSSSK